MVSETIDTAAELAKIDAEPLPESPQTTPGDTANPPADAAEQDVDAFLSSRKEGDQEGTEAGDEAEAGDELPEVKEAREAAAKAEREKIAREERERQSQEAKEREEQNKRSAEQKRFEENYRSRMESVKSVKQELDGLASKLAANEISAQQFAAESERISNRLANDFNSHHADGKKMHEEAANLAIGQAYNRMLNDAIRDTLGESAEEFFGSETEPKSYTDVKEALKAVIQISTKGLKTEAEAEADTKAALLKYRRSLEEKGLIQGARSGQKVNGSSSAPDDTYPRSSDGKIDTAAALGQILATSGG